MATLPLEAFYATGEASIRPPPPRTPVGWRKALFGDFLSGSLTILIFLVTLRIVAPLIHWALIAAVWHGGPKACATSGGACWTFLMAKGPEILFGIYPPEQRWRPVCVVGLFLALAIWTMPPRHWKLSALWAWVAGILAAMILMAGGALGLPFVPTNAWGGLPVTLMLTVLSLALGFPLGVTLALGRQSSLPVFRILSVGFIEVIRGLPLLTLLFVASILLPLMLPAGMTIDNFLRALVTLVVYTGAYIAEVLRGGLDDIPRGQFEVSHALGLTRWQTLRLIVLPQAVLKVIPPLTNTVVVIVKDTGLVLVIGLFDLLTAGRAALADPTWPFPYAETFLLIALVYFLICFSISRYSRFLERQLIL